jgi:hypothetical protein
MSTKQIPFTNHNQVVNYVNECYSQNLDMQNHKIWINSNLMRKYSNPKDLNIKGWLETNHVVVTYILHSSIHHIYIQYWDEADHQDFLNDLKEYLTETIKIAIDSAKKTQEIANRQVQNILNENEKYGWEFIKSNNDNDDTESLLGNNNSGLRKRFKYSFY